MSTQEKRRRKSPHARWGATLQERLDLHSEPIPFTECVIWTGSDVKGYGRLGVDGRLVMAHRVAYELAFGPVPNGMEIDHLCRVHSCINPRHLEAVTRRENVRRGVSVVARHFTATHCPHGHPYDETNTHIRTNGKWRSCRACWPVARARYEAKLRETAVANA